VLVGVQRHLDAGWFGMMAIAQAASFTSMWQVLRITLRVNGWFPVITSQLAGNAVSRIVPGGVAAGPALQFRMLDQAGIPLQNTYQNLNFWREPRR
jgi:hypothetical protein